MGVSGRPRPRAQLQRALDEHGGGAAAALEEQELGGADVAGLVERLGDLGLVEQADRLVEVAALDRVVGEQVEEVEVAAAQALARRGGPGLVAVGGQQVAGVAGEGGAGQAGLLGGCGRSARPRRRARSAARRPPPRARAPATRRRA